MSDLQLGANHEDFRSLPGVTELPAVQRPQLFSFEGLMLLTSRHVFEDKLRGFAEEHRPTPLMMFGVFDAPEDTDHPLAQPSQRVENDEFLTAPKAAWNLASYARRFDKLHQHIRQGDCYQANLTMPITASTAVIRLAASNSDRSASLAGSTR